ncbi:hypothetical protein CF645_37870 [Burkholderia pseudomallei]|nr:hypothetical protein CF645_37870 [Burkholderia pseudomallei]
MSGYSKAGADWARATGVLLLAVGTKTSLSPPPVHKRRQLDRLAPGMTVPAVALALGYANSSAIMYKFRLTRGTTPTQDVTARLVLQPEVDTPP